MWVDKQLEFSNSQAVTTSAISTNTYDTGGGKNVLKDQGIDSGLGAWLVVQVDVAFTGGTSIAVSLESDSTANLATSPTVHFQSAAIAAAALVPGTILVIPLPSGNYEQHMGVRYTVVGTFGAGQISAFITTTPQTWRPYANAI